MLYTFMDIQAESEERADSGESMSVHSFTDHKNNLVRHQEHLRRIAELRADVRRIQRENMGCAMIVFILVAGVLFVTLLRK
jgi:hypothetical protein